MNPVTALLRRFGYVRLKDHGLALGPGGRLISLTETGDDWQAPGAGGWVPEPSPSGFEPRFTMSATPAQPPPLPPGSASPEPPAASASPGARAAAAAPLFQPAAPAVPPDANAAAPPLPALDAEADEAPEDDEWEWRLAMARARARADAGDSAAEAEDAVTTVDAAAAVDPRGETAPVTAGLVSAAPGRAPLRGDTAPAPSAQDDVASEEATGVSTRVGTQVRQPAGRAPVRHAPPPQTAPPTRPAPAPRRRLARGSGTSPAQGAPAPDTAAARALAAARTSAASAGRSPALPRLSQHAAAKPR